MKTSNSDALRQSGECAYLQDRIELLRGGLEMARLSLELPLPILKVFIDNVLKADDGRRHGWEHSGLNEQPS